MTIGNEIDANIEAIRAARARKKTVNNKTQEILKYLYEGMAELHKKLDQSGYEIKYNGMDIIFQYWSKDNGYIKIYHEEKSQMVIGRLFKRTIETNKNKWCCITRTDYSGGNRYSVEGDQGDLDMFIKNYPEILVSISEKYKKAIQEEAEKEEARSEVGLIIPEWATGKGE